MKIYWWSEVQILLAAPVNCLLTMANKDDKQPKSATNKTPEQQMVDAGVSQGLINLIMRIAKGSGKISHQRLVI